MVSTVFGWFAACLNECFIKQDLSISGLGITKGENSMLRRVCFLSRARPVLLSPLRVPHAPVLAQKLALNNARRSYVELSDAPAQVVSYDDVSKWVKKPGDVTIIDVREASEFANGHIPGAINIPFKSSPGALGLDASDFEETFDAPKPPTDKPVLFYCQGGVRSSAAEQLASTYGYTKRFNYKGSYDDWLAHLEKTKGTAGSKANPGA